LRTYKDGAFLCLDLKKLVKPLNSSHFETQDALDKSALLAAKNPWAPVSLPPPLSKIQKKYPWAPVSLPPSLTPDSL
jgi:hypothetical protein